jgi:hypothetical protein
MQGINKSNQYLQKAEAIKMKNATTLESNRRHCWLKYCHSAINAHHHRSGLIRQGTGQEDYNEEVENLSTVKN